MSSEPYLSSECSREHPKHVNLVSCSVPDRCNCTCHNPFKLHVDLDETPNPIYRTDIVGGGFTEYSNRM